MGSRLAFRLAARLKCWCQVPAVARENREHGENPWRAQRCKGDRAGKSHCHFWREGAGGETTPSQKTGLTKIVIRKAGRSDIFWNRLQPVSSSRGPAMLVRAMNHAFDDMDRDAVYRAIFTRRDVRSHFTDEPVDDAVLARLINAAHHAPSVGYMQPWNFIVIRERERRARVRDLFLAARTEEALQMAEDKQALYRKLRLEGICESTLNLCVTCDRSRAADSPLRRWHNPDMDRFSTVCAVQNLWLAARAEGIGVGWVSILDKDALKTLLAIPDHVEPIAYLCVGHVSGFADNPDLEANGWAKRLPLAPLIMSEQFGGDGESKLKAAAGQLAR